MRKILIVDDEKNQREILSLILRKDGFDPVTAASAEEALGLFSKSEIDVVITDLMLPKMDGMELLNAILTAAPDTSVIIITGHGSIDSAVTAIKRGAYDYISKPLEKENILGVTRKAFERSNLMKERRMLISRHEGMVGEHPLFKSMLRTIDKIAPLDATVLITGESGTGKDVVARAIHGASPRRDQPFVAVNCAALPDNLIESELFGYVPGAFTGATTRKKGLFDAASGGSIFLDEISEIPVGTQAKLLRTLQNKEILPVGSTTPSKIDVRIIAATNRNLEEKVKTSLFRADLYYRLNVFSVRVPALRDRSSDIELLAGHMLEKYKYLNHGAKKTFTDEAIALFTQYPWPGNIRELETVVQKAIVYSENTEIGKEDVAPFLSGSDLLAPEPQEQRGHSELPAAQTSSMEGQPLDEIEKNLIISAMEKSEWKMSRACKILGITYRTLQYRLGKYGIKQRKDTPNG